MTRPIGVGLVGTGVVTTYDILPNLLQREVRDRLRLQAVCDVVEARARETAEHFGVPRWYTSPAELARDSGVEIVAIATPVPHHLAPALAAIQEGKHIYLQKTMTLTVEEADELIDAACQAGVKVAAAPGNHLRSHSFRAVREHIANGAIGKVCWGRAQKGTRHEEDARRQPGGVLEAIDPTWYYKPGGGPLRDAAVYDLHAVTWLLGPAHRVTAMSGIAIPRRCWKDRTIDVDMDDNTHFILDFGDSRYVVFSSHFIRGNRQVPSLELYGETGAIIMGGRSEGGYELFAATTERDRSGFVEQRIEVGAPERSGAAAAGLDHYIIGDLVHLADCILEDREPQLSAEQARHVIEIIAKTYESARLGKTLELTTTFAWP